ncbi:hypothetical protein [Crucian carp herpesvirus]|uniref:ORF147C n=1 Tax=Cyprinid herpesvirus 2 TaxID=317878 RepID=A0A0E3X9N1_CYHV2|nr:hypothetical protein [Cyprinid herpesvirus 2]AMB21715.1 ORF147C [Cyprinid herpesvirus 2]APB92996.1 hypothetical protein [Crucian carp herpesvirus]QIM55322.1 hypothetical protein [Cyprinid herpesvirus 2]
MAVNCESSLSTLTEHLKTLQNAMGLVPLLAITDMLGWILVLVFVIVHIHNRNKQRPAAEEQQTPVPLIDADERQSTSGDSGCYVSPSFEFYNRSYFGDGGGSLFVRNNSLTSGCDWWVSANPLYVDAGANRSGSSSFVSCCNCNYPVPINGNPGSSNPFNGNPGSRTPLNGNPGGSRYNPFNALKTKRPSLTLKMPNALDFNKLRKTSVISPTFKIDVDSPVFYPQQLSETADNCCCVSIVREEEEEGLELREASETSPRNWWGL